MPLNEWLQRNRLRTLAFLTAGLTLAVMAFQLMGANGLVLANGQPVFGDFLAFWSAGRLALEGHPELVYSKEAIAIAHLEALPALENIVFPWRHPPPFLLVVTPLAGLHYPYAAILFFVLTAAIYLFAARKITADNRDLIFAAAMPAALLHVGSVQVGLLVAGMTGLAFYWLDRRPLAAGAMIGTLVIKPHLAVLWPLYLAIAGRWRVFAAAAAVAILLCLTAGLVFGFDLYGAFIRSLSAAQHAVDADLIEKDTLTSFYANLLGLGVPPIFSAALHWASAIAAAAVATLVWRRGDAPASAAAFVCATLLFSPYLFFYDETLIIIAIAMLYREASPRESAWLAVAWASAALSLAAGKVMTIPICTIVAWTLLLIAAARAGVTFGGIAAPRRA